MIDKKIVKFIIIGGASTLIDFCVYMLIPNYIDVTISKIISMGVASIFSFILNKSWTFSLKKNADLKMVVLFYIGLLVNIAVNTSVNTVCFNLTKHKIISFCIATIVAMVVNYLIQNYIVFPNRKKAELSKKSHNTFSIIFPCYNESENLYKLVEILKRFPKNYDVEFILVENGSTDDSKEIFEKIKDERIKKVYVDKNRGYGYGIISGLKKSTGKYVGWLHSDLQYDPMELVQFFKYLNTNADENVLLKGRRLNRHLTEYIFTFFMGVYDTVLFHHRMKNVMAMPVIFDRDLLKYMNLFPFDYTIDIFIYALAQKKRYKIKFFDVHLRDRYGGKSSWNTGFASRIKQSLKMIDGSKKVKEEIKEMYE